MFQNIKVDIVYYKTNTDFEMEFNLCGCCRMRLLTDKASDKKALVHNLARAVSRSRVIILVGALFGGDGIIETAAQAIGKTLAEVDNRRYGIAGDEKITIINGATPLVTPDGYFGGCIIESGPQSMILLSENKSVRKTIMATLIHPYIEELCAIELKTKSAHESGSAAAGAVIPPVLPNPDTVIPKAEMPIIDISATGRQDNAENSTDTVLQNPADIISDNTAKNEIDSLSADMPQSHQPYGAETSDTAVSGQPESALSDTNSTVTAGAEKLDADGNASAKEAEKPLPPPEEDIRLSGKMTFETDDYRAVSADSNVQAPADNIDASSQSGGKAAYRTVEEDKKALEQAEIPFSKLHEDINKTSSVYDKAENDEDFDYDAGIPRWDRKQKSFFSSNLPILIISILLLVVIAVLCYCIFYIPAREGVSATAYLQETFKDFFA